jgi:hypothetical protein
MLPDPPVLIHDFPGPTAPGYHTSSAEGVSSIADPRVPHLTSTGRRPRLHSPPKPPPSLPGHTISDTNDKFAVLMMLEGEGSHSLMLTEFDRWAETFEELGQEGGGYGWHGVADALVRLKARNSGRRSSTTPRPAYPWHAGRTATRWCNSRGC